MEVFENALQTRFLKMEIYCVLVDADSFQIRKKSPFSKIPGYVWMGPEFEWALCEKRNNLDEFINTPTMAEERSMINISGLGPKIRTSRQAQSGIRAKIHSWSTIHGVFKIHDLPQKSIIHMLFKANSVDPITYSPPPGVVKPIEAISEALFFRPLYSLKQS